MNIKITWFWVAACLVYAIGYGIAAYLIPDHPRLIFFLGTMSAWIASAVDSK